MSVVDRLINEDLIAWGSLVDQYEHDTRRLTVPLQATPESLASLNHYVNELYTRAQFDFARARRNRDAIQRLLDSVLKDLYQGGNDHARRAGGIQYARQYPAPEGYRSLTVNLFDFEDYFLDFYYRMEAAIKSLEAKANAKITSNSLLKIESNVM